MQKQITLKLKPEEAALPELVHQLIAQSAGVAISAVTGYRTLKQSIDARSRQQVWINLTLKAFINEPFVERERISIPLDPIKTKAKTVIIIGAGPAGLFAALELIELGIKPIILERGKDVKARRRDLAVLNKEGIINPDSNYCFGEGGAGTYSDGKLYTRSSKRGSIDKVLQLFYQFGAEEKILYQSHPHIGTNKLPQIISAMREQIIAAGGEVHFETKVTNMVTKHNAIHGLITANGNHFSADAYILATGHSARDIFRLLHQKNILIEAKPFALGVRIEHPQSIIDAAQYHCDVRGNFLPPASYSLVEQVNQRGVFSFCMCPGGIIATASTDPGELVVNGWSPSKRNNPFANSGMVVQVAETDALNYFNKQSADALLLMDFQQSVEQKAYNAGGGKFVAPAQRMVDFCNNKPSSNLPDCSYLPGLAAANLKEVLPNFIRESLQGALKIFGTKMKGYYTNDAVLVATESRTSSPIRIPRDAVTLTHPQLNNLYPCGEGAGYAGGIVSAAMDGQKLARQIHLFFLCL
ncbi:MAG: FAD-binding protein [Sphingobacteriia bacterium 28-36-52]|nr:MAG: FAD-binding protein [Sphingobacteriia bacterium 32-37-4]OYZ00978.1 MAG: FAD-binding protein [Sphingobacteriia bacterium 28-36-52]